MVIHIQIHRLATKNYGNIIIIIQMLGFHWRHHIHWLLSSSVWMSDYVYKSVYVFYIISSTSRKKNFKYQMRSRQRDFSTESRVKC